MIIARRSFILLVFSSPWPVVPIVKGIYVIPHHFTEQFAGFLP
jgi:hypothetical protein